MNILVYRYLSVRVCKPTKFRELNQVLKRSFGKREPALESKVRVSSNLELDGEHRKERGIFSKYADTHVVVNPNHEQGMVELCISNQTLPLSLSLRVEAKETSKSPILALDVVSYDSRISKIIKRTSQALTGEPGEGEEPN